MWHFYFFSAWDSHPRIHASLRSALLFANLVCSRFGYGQHTMLSALRVAPTLSASINKCRLLGTFIFFSALRVAPTLSASINKCRLLGTLIFFSAWDSHPRVHASLRSALLFANLVCSRFSTRANCQLFFKNQKFFINLHYSLSKSKNNRTLMYSVVFSICFTACITRVLSFVPFERTRSKIRVFLRKTPRNV